ncbi:TorF family putative porin [Shewanella nanhaiensis]|uniref:TorF family putative porin n=1 Tax=Shewanella nanhaiensis TaxID=2864872 RepID=A0ABS7DZE9_9GAMM|nr:TorF family putative porin [Shewanella nanhaiensis]MBW8182786.1 TorF family putative porin [Shewanella nanhaiensis]
MKLALSSTLLASSLLTSFYVDASVTANIGATSNYLWRGVSQTQDAVAVQGGVDYEHESGLYLGTWASNVDFGDETSYELDFYAGYAGTIAEEFGYDVSYLYYAYPDSDSDIDFGELKAAISWRWFSLSYSHVINAGSDVATTPWDNEDMGYLDAGVSIPLSDTLSISAHYGYSTGDIVTAWFDTDSYSDYSLSLNKETEIGEVSFTVSDTDLNGDDAKIIIGYSYSFEL